MSAGFGYMAFSGLAAHAAKPDAYRNPLLPKKPHFEPRAKRVIFACMRGGPSHVDTFDHKPDLARNEGKKIKGRKLMPSPWEFTPHGQSGLMVSSLFPHLAEHADDLCLLNGMFADVPAHPQAFVQLHTGSFQFVRPSVGSWVLYGLGTENENLPGFISLSPPARVGGAQNYGSAFLPALYQGTAIGTLRRPIREASLKNLSNQRLKPDLQRKQIDFIQAMNRDLLDRHEVDSQINGVIESYELAFRMQAAVPGVMDLDGETEAVKEKYGIGAGVTDDFGRQCLMARRLAEAGVRYIELGHGNWDQHNGLRKNLTRNCAGVDQPLAALLGDLKDRGMLEDTLVIWGGEFGRTPHVKKDDGRDHNHTGFTFWMAGGGIKGGMRYGATDENGIAAVDNRVHFHDLHATILHQLGLDHEKLTYRYAGRDFRLTDVHGNVLRDILA
ncbi:MAG: DUF1501 domain-containing protein [Akkermansiaceae bacterium]|nr:DUF1501 domain-containing protein [Akkermansiaceae bacterium]NNM29623.1 DUF1501 domain-containing protein [Akkermansiaceae bacterium]